MTANVALTDTFDQWRVKTNEVVVMTQSDGMNNIIKTLDTTNSTSNTTGSIITAGGIAAKKSVYIGENLTVQGNVVVDGDTTISGNLTFGDAATDQVTFTADINSNIIPNANLSFNIGNTTMLWANTYTGHVHIGQKSDSGKSAMTVDATDVDQIVIDINAQQTTGDVVDITADSVTTAKVIDISADALTTGSAISVDSDSDDTGTRNIVSIIQNHASATAATALYVKQDSTLAAAKFDAQTTIIIPVGTTAQRGTAVQGGIRYNSTLSAFEGYSGSSWGSLGGLIDVDQDTYVLAETSAGADNDDLDFFTAGTQRMKIDETGIITVGIDGTGYDVTLFGDTAGSFLKWDQSADALLLTDSSPIHIGDGADMKLYHDGTNSYITNAVGALKLATETSGIAVTIGHTTSETTIADNLTVTGTLDVGGVTAITGAITVGVAGTGHDVTFFGDTSGKHLLWDQSADELLLATSTKLSFHDAAGGENILASADGHLEINAGTTLDITAPTVDINAATVLNIDGQTQITGQLIVGVDNTGHDVKFYGATAGSFLFWNEDEDRLQLTDSTPLSIGDGNDMNISHDGTNSLIAVGGGSLRLAAETSGIPITIGHTTSETTIGDNLTVTGTTTFTGTTDHNNPSQFDDTLTVGANDTGHDVTFYGAALGSLMMWDENTGGGEPALIVRGPTAEHASSSAGKILLQTAQTDIADGDRIGQIGFNSPFEGTGSDALLESASIWAEGAAAFAADVNATDLVFATGASEVAAEKMRITSDGKVGINTAAPAQLLQVYSAAAAHITTHFADATTSALGLAWTSDPAGGEIGVSRAGNEYLFINARYSASHIKFKVADSEKMTILANGRVGIGATTPDTYLMHLQKSNTDTSITLGTESDHHLVLHNNDVASTNTGRFVGMQFTINASSGAAARAGIYSTYEGDGDSDLHFYNSESATKAVVMTISHTSGGSVGIGTTAPARQFHMSSASHAYLRLQSTGSPGGYWDLLALTDAAFKIENASNLPAFNIENSGAVGINTSTPTSTLHVVNSDPGSGNAIIEAELTNNSNNPCMMITAAPAGGNATDNHGLLIDNRGGSGASYSLRVLNSSTEVMCVRANGLVGIGTAAPPYPLTVYKEVASGYSAWFKNNNGSGNGVGIEIKGNDDASLKALYITTWDSGTTWTTKFQIRRDGRVGHRMGGNEPQHGYQMNGTSGGYGDIGNGGMWVPNIYTNATWKGFQNWAPHSGGSQDKIMQHKGTYEWGYSIVAMQGHHGSNSGGSHRIYSRGYGYGGVGSDGAHGFGAQAPQQNGPRGTVTFTHGSTAGMNASSLHLKGSGTQGGSAMNVYNINSQ